MLKDNYKGSPLCLLPSYFCLMNYIDIILIVPLLWGLYKGFTKGLIIEAASIIALGLAMWGAIKFHDLVSVWMNDTMQWHSKYLPLLAFALIFIGVLLIVFGIAKLIETFVKAIALGFVNKLAGAVFGMLKFGLILSVLVFVLNAVEQSIRVIPAETKQGSLLYEPVGKIAPLVIPGLLDSKLRTVPLADSTDAR